MNAFYIKYIGNKMSPELKKDDVTQSTVNFCMADYNSWRTAANK